MPGDILSRVHYNNGLTGAATLKDSSLAAVIVSASVGAAALAGVGVYAIVRKMKKAKATADVSE